MRKILLTIVSLCFVFSCKETIKEEKIVVEEQVANTEVAEATEANAFWDSLQALCGKAFEGTLVLPENDPDFGGKQLVMHVRSCEDNVIRIPFFVGDDKSRTWVLTFENGRIELKHDHRHEDGTEDDITMYGGITTNSGQANIQTFSADQHTKTIIPAASTNIWWITVDDKQFTYNLRRLGTDRVFTVAFDLTKTITTPEAPWGWED
jgi:hypothetical protein